MAKIPDQMKAMVLEEPNKPLELKELKIPEPDKHQVLVKINACGVCRTDLHIVDGELTQPKLPLIPGHEIIGEVVKSGKEVKSIQEGQKIGIPWLGYTCGQCSYCQKNQENLCENAGFTGYTIDGGFSEFTVADANYCFKVAGGMNDVTLTPLLCAGLIGYRSYQKIGHHVKKLGIYGFGAAGHILAQVATHQGKAIYAFTKPGDTDTQAFAKDLGAEWAGGSDTQPPVVLDAAIIFAPVGSLVPEALKAVDKGGNVVCGGIQMSDIPSFPYEILWEERMLKSVANLKRNDGEGFLKLAPQIPVKTETTSYKLEQANEALDDLRNGNIHGAAVLKIK